MTRPDGTNGITIAEYEINPAIDEKLFQPPAQAPSQGLTLKVQQEQSVPYVQQSGGGISTNCSIVGSANTSAYANTVGNSTYGNATTSSSQHMNCNSYDTTVRWPHVLNAGQSAFHSGWDRFSTLASRIRGLRSMHSTQRARRRTPPIRFSSQSPCDRLDLTPALSSEIWG